MNRSQMTANPCGKVGKGTELSKQRQIIRVIGAELDRRRTDYARGIAFVGGSVGGCAHYTNSKLTNDSQANKSHGRFYSVLNNSPLFSHLFCTFRACFFSVQQASFSVRHTRCNFVIFHCQFLKNDARRSHLAFSNKARTYSFELSSASQIISPWMLILLPGRELIFVCVGGHLHSLRQWCHRC